MAGFRYINIKHYSWFFHCALILLIIDWEILVSDSHEQRITGLMNSVQLKKPWLSWLIFVEN